MFLASAGAAVAQSLPIETDQYKIYVDSPLEQWSGNASELKASAKAHSDKQTSYRVMLDQNNYLLGHPTVFQGPSKHPLIQETNVILTQLGFSIPRDSSNYFQVELPLTLTAEDAKLFLTFQSDLRRRGIISQGDPDTVTTATTVKKVLGTFAGLGLTAVSVEKFGTVTGMNLSLGSGLADDVYRIFARYKTWVTPVSLNVDIPEGVKYVEFRRVNTADRDRSGQIVIMYKQPQTEGIELAAMREALIALSGARITPAQVQEARAKDLADRKELWRACVATGDCK